MSRRPASALSFLHSCTVKDEDYAGGLVQSEPHGSLGGEKGDWGAHDALGRSHSKHTIRGLGNLHWLLGVDEEMVLPGPRLDGQVLDLVGFDCEHVRHAYDLHLVPDDALGSELRVGPDEIEMEGGRQ